VPIPQHLRVFYGKEWREVTRPRILARATNKCEKCGVPNRETVLRTGGWWLEFKVSWKDRVQRMWRDQLGLPRGSRRPKGTKVRRVKIVLTIAHLDQTPGHDHDDNLAAMCQWCHLSYDREQHMKNGRETRMDRKDAERPLLATAHAESERL